MRPTGRNNAHAPVSYLSFALRTSVAVITKLTGTAPADFTKTELYRAFGYVNDCVWLDYPPASNVAPTMWACFLFPWMAYALTWQARLASKVEPYGPVRVITQRVFQVCTVYEVFAGVHFIQCFCNKPWDSPFPLGLKMHTYPFTMFIFALWVSSMKNAYWFYNFGNGSANTKRAIALFELLYVPLAFGKILIEVNFFLDSYFFVSGNPQAAQIGVVRARFPRWCPMRGRLTLVHAHIPSSCLRGDRFSTRCGSSSR